MVKIIIRNKLKKMRMLKRIVNGKKHMMPYTKTKKE